MRTYHASDEPRCLSTPPKMTSAAVQAVRERTKALREQGATNALIHETLTAEALARKEVNHANRCRRCWHDAERRCICKQLPSFTLGVRVKVLVLQHSSEYLAPGDDAKLLLALCPSQVSLFIFGKPGDDQALRAELSVDPTHTLLLWPGAGALTIDEFIDTLPEASPWRTNRNAAAAVSGGTEESLDAARSSSQEPTQSCELPLLRVVVLDGVYNDARTMFRHFCKRLQPAQQVRHVALHPKTLSVYHRAKGNYGKASASGISRDGTDPDALRICTVEAVALLLQELGEPSASTEAMVRSVLLNNEAVAGRMARVAVADADAKQAAEGVAVD